TENAHIVILIKAVIRKLDVKALSGMTGTQQSGFPLSRKWRDFRFLFAKMPEKNAVYILNGIVINCK
ncbi:TPA: hypothetical protein ACFODC_002102, partial [Neisseria meningitidis]